jgi:hypothetical protein
VIQIETTSHGLIHAISLYSTTVVINKSMQYTSIFEVEI